MSNLKAKRCLEHLLYEISDKILHNVAARLAQMSKQPVTVFANSKGNWSWAVVEQLLIERGYKCTQATLGDAWIIDSPKYISQSPGFIGFISKDTLDCWKWNGHTWSTPECTMDIEETYTKLQKGNTVAVHKMWAPLEPFFRQNKPFHITTDDSGWTRYECQPSSCWRPEPVSYEKRDTAVKQFMKAHKKSKILISNSQEMVLAFPSKDGWKTEPILNYECFMPDLIAKQVSEILAQKVVTHIEEQGGDGWQIMAHALFSTYHQLGKSLKIQDFSNLTQDELDILEKYATGMYKKTDKKNTNGKRH